jgi:uncharacterized protein
MTDSLRGARPGTCGGRGMEWVLVLALGVVAGTVGGIIGFGAAIVVLPALVWSFGTQEAIPIMAIAGLMANASRFGVWWHEVDWKLNGVYCAAAVPTAFVGTRTLLSLDPRLAEGALGAFLLASIPIRRWLTARGFQMTLPAMAIVGGVIGFISGVVASTGPINTPFFLAYGLTGGRYIGTEAVGSAAISLTKILTFQTFGALSQPTLIRGLCVGTALMAGSWISKQVLLKLDTNRFKFIVEAMMLAAGLAMLGGALVQSNVH